MKGQKCNATYKPKRGRPPTGFDKKAYMKEYMRKRRTSKAKDLPKTHQTTNMTPII